MFRFKHLPALLSFTALCLTLQSCHSNAQPEPRPAPKVKNNAQLGVQVKALNNQALDELYQLTKDDDKIPASIRVADEARTQKWQHIVDTLETANMLWPYRYKIGEKNLSVILNNHAIELSHGGKKLEAIAEFDHSIFMDPKSSPACTNINALITSLGKKPDNFADRTAFGDAATARKDYVAAMVEYSIALSIKDSVDLREKVERAKIALLKNSRPIFKKVQAGRTY